MSQAEHKAQGQRPRLLASLGLSRKVPDLWLTVLRALRQTLAPVKFFPLPFLKNHLSTPAADIETGGGREDADRWET